MTRTLCPAWRSQGGTSLRRRPSPRQRVTRNRNTSEFQVAKLRWSSVISPVRSKKIFKYQVMSEVAVLMCWGHTSPRSVFRVGWSARSWDGGLGPRPSQTPLHRRGRLCTRECRCVKARRALMKRTRGDVDAQTRRGRQHTCTGEGSGRADASSPEVRLLAAAAAGWRCVSLHVCSDSIRI